MVFKGVKTVAMGGRPLPGPMQAIGGVKGSQVLELSGDGSLSQATDMARELAQADGAQVLSQQDQSQFDQVMPIPLEDFPLPLSLGSVNYRNTFSQTNDQVPTQFVYEPANCHLFYTLDTLASPEATWALAANAVWGSGSCVGGVQQVQNNSDNGGSDGSDGSDGSGGSGSQDSMRKLLGLLLTLGNH